ncbi:hypothetical protein LZQ00_00640 [Sphingobacterium sp. SRCM116780]|uniref:hypothetical protein n=1 Tax=Sphingobacterium sp. SRCM116780 TaxID=2907623 RepID=UPI001F2E61A4|nr:hypothetical protein [Sphingobacterium sp. SRCM116780]UIR56349.1 hypothetical protein LZQ00_00640 [Sphingobacterium sp. SRCM116780]
MKKIAGMIIVILLINGCGLFKKTSKTKQLETVEAVKTIKGNLQQEKQIEMKTETDLQSFVWKDGQIVTQLEGEDIVIAKDGTVRMGKGKVKKQEVEKSNVVQLKNQTKEIHQNEKSQESIASKQKLAFEKKVSSQVNEPESSNFFWFWIGLVGLIFICLYWIKKRIGGTKF